MRNLPPCSKKALLCKVHQIPFYGHDRNQILSSNKCVWVTFGSTHCVCNDSNLILRSFIEHKEENRAECKGRFTDDRKLDLNTRKRLTAGVTWCTGRLSTHLTEPSGNSIHSPGAPGEGQANSQTSAQGCFEREFPSPFPGGRHPPPCQP